MSQVLMGGSLGYVTYIQPALCDCHASSTSAKSRTAKATILIFHRPNAPETCQILFDVSHVNPDLAPSPRNMTEATRFWVVSIT